MASFDITSFIQNNVSTLTSLAQVVAGTVVSSMLLRKRTSVETGTIEFEKIKAGKFSEAVDLLLESGKITYTEFFKMQNYADIARKADELRTEPVAELPQQDFDWHIRFYEACGNVTNEEMQNLWAQVLSGEIRHPGSYSLRTMECLRNLTKEEAELFHKICECSAKLNNHVALLRIGGIMEKNGITYDDVLKLADCGLMKSDVGLNIGFAVGEKFSILSSDDHMVLLVKMREGYRKKRLAIPDYLFTAAGTELYSVAGGKTDLDNLRVILQNEYQEYEFACGNILRREGDQITYTVISLDTAGI